MVIGDRFVEYTVTIGRCPPEQRPQSNAYLTSWLIRTELR